VQLLGVSPRWAILGGWGIDFMACENGSKEFLVAKKGEGAIFGETILIFCSQNT